MTDLELERARIRALVVARMNTFRERAQEDEDYWGEDSEFAHAWILAKSGMEGLLIEIDSGKRLADMTAKDYES